MSFILGTLNMFIGGVIQIGSFVLWCVLLYKLVKDPEGEITRALVYGVLCGALGTLVFMMWAPVLTFAGYLFAYWRYRTVGLEDMDNLDDFVDSKMKTDLWSTRKRLIIYLVISCIICLVLWSILALFGFLLLTLGIFAIFG